MESYSGLVKTLFLVIFLFVSCVHSFVWYGGHGHVYNQLQHQIKQTLQPQLEDATPTPYPFTFWRKRKRASLITQIFPNTKPKLRKVLIKDGRLTKLSKIEKLLERKVKFRSTKIGRVPASVPYFKKYNKSKQTATELLHHNHHKTNIPRLAHGLLVDGTFYEIDSQTDDKSVKTTFGADLLQNSHLDDEQRVIGGFQFPNFENSQSATLKDTEPVVVEVKSEPVKTDFLASDNSKWSVPEQLESTLHVNKGSHQRFADGFRTLNSYVPPVEAQSNTGQIQTENTRGTTSNNAHAVSFGDFDSFLQDQSSQGTSSFDGVGPSSNTGFVGGGFDMDGSHCEDIETRTCATEFDCSCYGFYHCSSNKCHLLDNLDAESDSDSLPIGTWYDEPRMLK